MKRKARTLEELLNDNGFPYHVGQLMGATEMAAHWLKLRDDADAKAMGEKLSEIVGWFFVDENTERRERREQR